MHRVFLAGLLLAWAADSFAQSPALPPAVLVAEADDAVPGRTRTLGRARTYSLAGMLVPVGAGIALAATNASDGAVTAGAVLLTVGLVAGPSTGHFYLGDGRRAWIGIGLRTAAFGAGVLVASISGNDGFDFLPIEGVIVTTAGLVAGTVYSFATLDNTARERGLVLVPDVRPDGRSALTLVARF